MSDQRSELRRRFLKPEEAADYLSRWRIDLAAEMRSAADLLEKFNRLYAVDGGAGEWSPNLLRKEADYLARPIPGEAS